MDPLIEQSYYYNERASEYDECFERIGRYDRGDENNRRWLDAVQAVRAEIDAFRPTGNVLELAPGTGNWTWQLSKHADRVVAVDFSESMLHVCRQKVKSRNVEYLQADIFSFQPSEQFDTIFFGLWISHVPKEKAADFWAMVASALKSGGRVLFVDTLPNPIITAHDHEMPNGSTEIERRKLNDGRSFQIVKRYFTPTSIQMELELLGWKCSAKSIDDCFLFATAEPDT
ncbi:MAG: class I SAM-dependent methyltransferase [Planctomycetaceae bacterium]|nr:class I SAM-dependent methyltransferase [Planctomycetales bacterium]MCB9924358.1 class I SAM-dependent methyltransferase [Planctomycetaceae bacterium]